MIVPKPIRAIRTWFCLAAALVAASIADPLVEFASNRGVFGRGVWTDHSNQDVLPALCAGLLLAAVYVALRTLRLLKRRFVAPAAAGSLLPYVFALQIALLFVMETLEQQVVTGHALGGTVWLGGPPPASLAAHAVACVAVTFLLGRLTRALGADGRNGRPHISSPRASNAAGRAVRWYADRSGADVRSRARLLGPSGKRASSADRCLRKTSFAAE